MTDDVMTVMWTPAGTVRLIDQTRLPLEEVYVECRSVDEIAEAIRSMRVRGAPAIGVTAAMGMALGARAIEAREFKEFWSALEQMGVLLTRTRPTAVNLAWAVRRMLSLARKSRHLPLPEIKAALVAEAQAICDEDLVANRAIGRHGQTLVPDPARVLTHCNAGGLATAGYGTAVGVIRAAAEAGKRIMVWVDETRPLLQGARLTAWEFARLGIPATLITDNMAAHCMSKGMVSKVFAAADRVAMDGVVANKVGTLQLAICAQYFKIPFYILAYGGPDKRTLCGEDIPIEERDPREVLEFRGTPISGPAVKGYYPAFDLTPAELVTGIVTARGITTRERG